MLGNSPVTLSIYLLTLLINGLIKSFTSQFPILALILLSNMVLAQRITLSGVLVDNKSLDDLSGVHIYSKEHIGTTSDLNGNFSFKVHHLDTLHFSRVGYDSLALVITETDSHQNIFISMKRSIRMLDDVEINAIFQANTILKRPIQKRLKLRGFNYPDKPYEEDYHMGLSALASPMTALYRMFSKRYKEKKKNYQILKARTADEAVFTKASNNLSIVLEMTDEYIDEYFYRDFIQHSGLTMRFVAESSEYDLLVALPRAISAYQTYLIELEEQNK